MLKVSLNHLKIAPRKVRLAAALIKGLTLNEAEAQLLIKARKANKPLLKLLYSAAANAKHNHRIEPDRLKIKTVAVDEGPKTKRWMPRARGGVSLIQKKSSHVTLFFDILPEDKIPAKPRFQITLRELKKAERKAKRKKKEIGAKEKAVIKEKEKESEKPKPLSRPGFFRRIFRRKSI